MKDIEFITLLAANANKTQRIRTYSGEWHTGINYVPDVLAREIGKVIALLHEQLNKGNLCKQDEYLLIYNFQPLAICEHCSSYTLDMRVKPLSNIHHTARNVGKPFQLVVDGNTQEVFNMTKAMLDIGLTYNTPPGEEVEPPTIYGNYRDYKAPCSFVAIASYRPIANLNDFFSGVLDNSAGVRNSVAFDSLVEAQNYLSNKNELGRYVAEIIGAKEDLEQLKRQGLSKQIHKAISLFDQTEIINPNNQINQRDRVDNRTSPS